MKKVSGLLVLGFLIFSTCVLAAPPTFGPPGIAPDLEADISPMTYPNILGYWEGKCRDIRYVDFNLPPYKIGPYEMTLIVRGQDGPRFVGDLYFDLETGLLPFYTVAGYITGEGEITFFGGIEKFNYLQSGRLTGKAKLYKNPERSIRGSWQAFTWEIDGLYDDVSAYSGSFVLTPMEQQQTDQ